MVAPLYTTASGLLFHAGKILVLTIGLPARGKTHISRALERYLRWTGVKTQVVSLGDYRRKILGATTNVPPDYFTLGEKSPETQALRKKISEGCEKLIWDFFEGGGQVVIYDANNGTKAARQAVAEKFDKAGIHVIMLETICDNREIIENNIRSVKISSPDYRGWEPDKAVEDYYKRIHDHEKYYETISDKTWPYIRIFNASRGEDYAESDADLSPAGWEYAEQLKDFVLERRAKSLTERGLDPSERRLVIWTSTHRRAHHTAWPFLAAAQASNAAQGIETATQETSSLLSATDESHMHTKKTIVSRISSPALKVKVVEKPQMLEINPGIWDGLSPEQAQKYYPKDWERFLKDPYSFRAPRAESYHDLSVRLDPVLIELEKEQSDLLIIGHASVIRCMLAYLIGLPASEIPAIEIARGDLLEVVPASYGVHSQAFHFWDGPGRRAGGLGAELGQRESSATGESTEIGESETHFYENYAEDTRGKRQLNTPEPSIIRP
ncbi:hypothetical protein H0H81_012462 [Sphagnurus paluster]|uniref:6-phosphofructo-2-kinase domain-containing protein n=1 Tax=Sphagnurus paluster TaxID=117069 RepID=A0A9P7FPT8_9AGAR|nr:hypothetical protein H0H81_012462 [Sphagnurus paluster]